MVRDKAGTCTKAICSKTYTLRSRNVKEKGRESERKRYFMTEVVIVLKIVFSWYLIVQMVSAGYSDDDQVCYPPAVQK